MCPFPAVLFCYLFLGPHGIDRNSLTFYLYLIQKFRDCRNLIVLFLYRLLAQAETILPTPGRNNVGRFYFFRLLERMIFPSIQMIFFNASPSFLLSSSCHFPYSCRRISQQSHDPVKGIMGWNPIFQPNIFAQVIQILLCKHFHFRPVIYIGQHCKQDNDQYVFQLAAYFSCLTHMFHVFHPVQQFFHYDPSFFLTRKMDCSQFIYSCVCCAFFIFFNKLTLPSLLNKIFLINFTSFPFIRQSHCTKSQCSLFHLYMYHLPKKKEPAQHQTSSSHLKQIHH